MAEGPDSCPKAAVALRCVAGVRSGATPGKSGNKGEENNGGATAAEEDERRSDDSEDWDEPPEEEDRETGVGACAGAW